MVGHFEEALEYFGKAAALYEDIGDEVSYAWTLWSWGTAFKVLGELGKRVRNSRLPRGSLRRPRDTRGMVYYLLSVAEVTFLEGKKDEALGFLKEAEDLLVEKPFRLEKVHVKLYRWLMGEGEDSLSNIRGLYEGIGAHFLPSFPTLPLNIP